MAKTRISALAAILAVSLTAADVFPLTDTSVPKTNKVTLAQLRTALLTGGAGYDTTDALSLNGGTITTTKPLINGVQTWNAVGTTFTAQLVNVTDTASAAASLLADYQVGGVSKFNVRKDGRLTLGAGVLLGTGGDLVSNPGSISRSATYGVALCGAPGATYDFVLFARDGATGILSNPANTSNLLAAGTLDVQGSAGFGLGNIANRRRLQSTGASGFNLLGDDNGFASISLSALTAAGTISATGLITANGGILVNNGGGGAGQIYSTASAGTVIWGKTGASTDLLIANGAGVNVMSVPTGTANVQFAGAVTAAGDVTTTTATVAGYNFYNTNYRIRVTQATGAMDFLTNNVVGLSLVNGGGGAIVGQLITPDVASASGGIDLTFHNGGTLVATFSGTSGTATFTGSVNATGQVSGTNLIAGAANAFVWNGRSRLNSPADGVVQMLNNASTGFTRLVFGGTSTSFPALNVNGATLETKLGDNSAYAVHRVGSLLADSLNFSNFSGAAKIIGGTSGIDIRNNADSAANIAVTDVGIVSSRSHFLSGGDVAAAAGSSHYWTGLSLMKSPSDGTITLTNNAGTAFSFLQFGGTTSSFPAIQRSGAGFALRLADNSGQANLSAGTGSFFGAVGISVTTGTTTLLSINATSGWTGVNGIVLAQNPVAGTGFFHFQATSASVPVFQVRGDGAVLAGSPVGGTSALWKFGSRVAATVALVTSQYIELDVGGTLYKLATVS